MRRSPPARRRARTSGAFSLIEAMIAVAMLGIVLGMAAVAVESPLLPATSLIVEERALQWLEYEAAARVQGRRPDPEVVERLRALVPEGELRVDPRRGGLLELEVSWRSPHTGAPTRRSLVIVSEVRS